MSDQDPLKSMHRPVQAAHSSFIEGSHMTKNMASELLIREVTGDVASHEQDMP